jgi:soluble cytochrome b562
MKFNNRREHMKQHKKTPVLSKAQSAALPDMRTPLQQAQDAIDLALREKFPDRDEFTFEENKEMAKHLGINLRELVRDAFAKS